MLEMDNDSENNAYENLLLKNMFDESTGEENILLKSMFDMAEKVDGACPEVKDEIYRTIGKRFVTLKPLFNVTVQRGENLCKIPPFFKEGINCLMLINRRITNPKKGMKRWINKLISYDTSSYTTALNALLLLQHFLNDPSIRLYASINSRKMEKAIVAFKHRQLDVLRSNQSLFYCDVHEKFFSCLMKPENKLTKRFLIDIDTTCDKEIEKVTKWVHQNTILLWEYFTPHGKHLITNPFNIKEWPFKWEIKKDGLLLLNSLKGSRYFY